MAIAKFEYNESPLKQVLDYMENNFNGNIGEVASLGAEYAKRKGLAFGPLWDEVGCKMLHEQFRKDRIQRPRWVVSRVAGEDATEAEPKGVNQSSVSKLKPKTWYVSINGTFYNLFDLYAEDVRDIAKSYQTLADANQFEAEFYNKVADKLPEGKRVGEVFTVDDLREMRRKDA